MAMESAVAPATEVRLPCGLMVDGELKRDALIVPMTGKARKMVSRPEMRRNPAKVIDALLGQCLTEVGGETRIRSALTQKLFVADRDFLLLKIREISLGSVVHSQVKCGVCGAQLDVSMDLTNDIKVRTYEDLVSDYEAKAEGGDILFSIADQDLQLEATFRLPKGEDQVDIAPLLDKNPVAASYTLYERCLIEWNGTPASEMPPQFFDNLPLPVIDFVDEEFTKALPGPDMRVPVDCVQCGEEMTMTLASSDFLFRRPQRERT